MKKTNLLLALLDEALDEQGNPRACGREHCKEVIRLANELFPGPYYGDVETGMMKPAALNDLRETLYNQ